MDMRPMELKDTVEMMQSADYKERVKAEYYQAIIRHSKLKNMLRKYDEGTLSFVPITPIEILRAQKGILAAYVHLLRERARVEEIDLEVA